MNDNMKDSLARIELALKDLQRDVLLETLQPGIDEHAVRDAVSKAGLSSISEIELLYGWHDGVDPNSQVMLDDIQMFPGFHMLSMDEAIETYSALKSDARWKRGWFPVFADGGGDFYVVDLRGTQLGSVRLFWSDELDHPIEFNALSDMMRTLAQGFTRGVFYIDSRGYLEMNDEIFDRLVKEMNPDIDS